MYQRLLVPVDGTELSGRAMEESIRLARQLGAEITGFIAEPAVALPSSIGTHPDRYQRAATAHEEMTAEHARKLLGRFEARAREAGVEFKGHYTRNNNIDAAIADAAHEQGCDMIVMVTHGRGAFGELLFGSHTKAVMSRSKLPVLVLH
ncbi:universal stress protein [Azohydromonas caseinilytica]|uniref:Universal stress protein n=1 Tax=Azohydromonas caseinilytica TaxID=2728836 RepID=A0A848F6Q9_9BURK|nr:universal stress protein [Azohydromonas caseinilytica]NML15264.1 universal stress protein [Azohydromonas caseinilytica]